VGYVEDAFEVRTKLGKCASQGEEAVLADSGRAGEKTGLFSILSGRKEEKGDG
jgi:hypothetical protein